MFFSVASASYLSKWPDFSIRDDMARSEYSHSKEMKIYF